MFDVIIFTDSPSYGRARGHGAHRIASHVREHDYSCLVIDHIGALTFDLYKKILDLAVGENTLVVGYSSTWFTTDFHPLRKQDTLSNAFNDLSGNSLERWIEYPKTINTNLKTILGGARNYKIIKGDFDHIIVGLAENMFMDLLNSLSGKTEYKTFNRIIDYDTEAKHSCWDFRTSSTTYNEFDLIQSHEPLTLELARGCKFKCKFCTYPLIGKKNIDDYLRKSECIRKELLDNYEKWGTTRYYIVDDTFNDSVEKIQMMLDITNSLPFKPEYWAFSRLDLLISFPETIPMLRDMGLKQTYIGIETFNEAAGKAVGKGLTREKKIKGLEELKRIWQDQVNIQSGFIVGLPHESRDSIKETFDYLMKPDCPIHFAYMIPLFLTGPNPQRHMELTSIFDREYYKYGYSFPDSNSPHYWEKNDDADIYNLIQAVEIAEEYNNQLPKTLIRNFSYSEVLDYPKYDGLEKASLSAQEYETARFDMPTILSNQNLIYQNYFMPLVNKLEEARNLNWRTSLEEFNNLISGLNDY